MYQTSLYYTLKATSDNKKILELFFQDWTDGICNEEVEYSTVATIIRVDFKNVEDAVAMKLRGIPLEFQKYLEIVNNDFGIM